MYGLISSDSSSILRNPSQTGYFWIGTTTTDNAKRIYFITSNR